MVCDWWGDITLMKYSPAVGGREINWLELIILLLTRLPSEVYNSIVKSDLISSGKWIVIKSFAGLGYIKISSCFSLKFEADNLQAGMLNEWVVVALPQVLYAISWTEVVPDASQFAEIWLVLFGPWIAAFIAGAICHFRL